MKIKVSTILMNPYGEPLKSQRMKKKKKPEDPPEQELLTLRDVMVNALLGDYQDEKSLSGEKKLERYLLAMKIQAAKIDIDIDTKQIVLIKDLIAKAFSPVVSGQAWKLIEP